MSISKEEKMKKILEFTDRIEKTAKRKEQLNKIGSGGVDDELDALYLEAIEAKLGLLDDYWSFLTYPLRHVSYQGERICCKIFATSSLRSPLASAAAALSKS